MEDKLYNALARVLVAPYVDSYGNVQQSPLAEAIRKWSWDKREDIAAAVVKHLGKEEMAEKVATKVLEELTKKNWSNDFNEDNLKKLVIEKLSTMLAEKEMEKLNNPELQK